MNKIIPLLFLISLFFSCKSEKTLNDFKWFLGKWKGTMQGMDVRETWTMENETSFNGDGFVMSDMDTIFHESTKLQVQNGNIFYIANVPGNPAPVSFKLTFYENHKAIFENPEHDFPKKIIYTHVLPDSLIAVVEGEENGQYRKEELYFKKIN